MDSLEAASRLDQLVETISKYIHVANLTAVQFILNNSWVDELFPAQLRLLEHKIRSPDIFAKNTPLTPTPSSLVEDILEVKDLVEPETPLSAFVQLVKRFSSHDLEDKKLFEGIYAYDDASAMEKDPPHIIQGMSPKKTYEVRTLFSLVQRLFFDHQMHSIVEIGSGYGYLSSYLALKLSFPLENDRPTIRVLGLEMNEAIVDNATERYKRIRSAKKFRLLEESQRPVHFAKCKVTYPPNPTYNKLLNDLGNAEVSESSKAMTTTTMMIGLHGCGDLSADMIRLFKEDSRFKILIQFGCCYNLLSESSSFDEGLLSSTKGGGFPLSAHLKHKRPVLQLGKYLRNAACVTPLKDLKDTLRNSTIFKWYCFTALFHIILLEEKLSSHPDLAQLPMLGNIKRLDKNIDFSDFCELLFTRLQLPFIGQNRIKAYVNKYEGYIPRLWVLFSFQKWLGYLTEQLITLDRAMFGLEARFSTVATWHLFDPCYSPRSKVLLLIK